MKALHRRCAGLGVHQQEIVACRRIVAGRKVQTEVGRFSTTTQGLLELADWLDDGRVTHIAMEATGVYWKPVWHVLHGRFTLILTKAVACGPSPRSALSGRQEWLILPSGRRLAKQRCGPPAHSGAPMRPTAGPRPRAWSRPTRWQPACAT
jgi:hypothetical protein